MTGITQKIDAWEEEINSLTNLYLESFAKLDEQALNWKPHPEQWSIGQNINHLIAINSSYMPILQSLRAGTYKVPLQGKIGFVVNFLGNMILKYSLPDRKRPMETFPIWEPGQQEVSRGIFEQFAQSQTTLLKQIKDSQDLMEAGTVICSPANGHIVYRLDQAFEIIIAHEHRHFEQAKLIREQLP